SSKPINSATLHTVFLSFSPTFPPPSRPTFFPYTTLFRSPRNMLDKWLRAPDFEMTFRESLQRVYSYRKQVLAILDALQRFAERQDRKSTRLNSSHLGTSYAVFCL